MDALICSTRRCLHINIYENKGLFNAHILEFNTLPSTNDYLLNKGEDLPNGTVITANSQTKGKGRAGRTWEDSCGKSISMSLLLNPVDLQDLAIIPLIAGLAVSNVLSKNVGKNAYIKWPNDIIMGNKKICGVLCESRISSKSAYAVCGIGVNILQQEDYFKQVNLPYATSIFMETGIRMDINDILSKILSELETLYTSYKSFGFGKIRKSYIHSCITLDKDVKIIYNNNTTLAHATSVGNTGQLICTDSKNNEFEVFAGDVSVRGLYEYV